MIAFFRIGDYAKANATERDFSSIDAILDGPPLTFDVLRLDSAASGSNGSRPASQGISPKHCTLPVRRAEGFWRCRSVTCAICVGLALEHPCRRRAMPADQPRAGPSTAARSAAVQPSVV